MVLGIPALCCFEKKSHSPKTGDDKFVKFNWLPGLPIIRAHAATVIDLD